MGFFDKVTSTAKGIGKSVTNRVSSDLTNAGSNAVVATQEQTELVELRSQVNVINQELDSAYVQVGRKYVDYVVATQDMPGIDVSDILALIDPKLTKKAQLEQEIIRLEKEIKQKTVLREKQEAEEIFLKEKDKLDKALGMDVITQDENNERIASARKKVDNFEAIRKVRQQAEMGLITAEEMNAKIKALTE